ncbi:UDP-2,4-diacetamido-2,4,6-trideoxy-beta-L-altropyranose hydrolase [Gayadomonas joobiniege]|uniref:UDP-2,4-diacetamido-2,4, 6-trideoxy-beta-L-altropyranose hydrolase n=1 Tax=Gayadomonas joobiniege TaxID=1234606 RepID=UPI00037770BF|nr:UDP-2,4-diacetamido-2,4,6-trideoxy-beta-L-altropyranose hydrolase [Gayadomonas joobiniege]
MFTPPSKAIIFRVEAGEQIGMGHLMRCISLAQAAHQVNIEAIFFVSKATFELANKLNTFTFKLHLIDHLTSDIESQLLEQITSEYKVLHYVLDGYQFSLTYRTQLKQQLMQHSIPLVILDDNGGEQHGDLVAADIVVNPTCADGHVPDYARLVPQAKVYAGNQYRLLRNEFVEQAPNDFEKRHGIVVTMGGSDPLNYSQSCLEVLHQLNINLPVTCLIAGGFSHKNALISFIKQLPDNFCYLYQPGNIASIFAEAKFAISAAGGTQFELYAMHTPAILLVSFNNQWRNSQSTEAQGWAKVLDFRHRFDKSALTDSILQLLQTDKRRQMYLSIKPGLAQGAERLIEALSLN